MWLFTNFSFFSVVQKGEGISSPSAAVKGDFERLLNHYLPSLASSPAT